MVVTGSVDYTYKFPWKTVVGFTWFKFPDPAEPRVRCVTVGREVSVPDVEVSEDRLFTVDNDAPSWIKAVLGVKVFEFTEVASINNEKEKLVINTKNITFSSIMSATETSSYVPDSQNSDWTHFHQDLSVQVKLGWLSHKIEKYAVSYFTSEARNSHQRMSDRIKNTLANGADPDRIFDRIFHFSQIS
ncbi:mitochondrial mitochondrial IMS protein UPS2 [Andalucia godoyi]|uniref:Mitochondrial mitochondrial IMS protein UPS2 n=1 Tax=Andalucia godoyi TaxID=505711 RepID=A0A8K0AHN7_ANDGO|nr:mitochondrial mitochondrial IMS protein UPS2 [Andalucia godoyi]|eukprot:ANDGO_03162.mRNA.1 mitochondrial mitochondrial IMS protein UPS2